MKKGKRNENRTKCLFVLEICSFIYWLLLPALHVIPFHFASFSCRRVFIRNGSLRSCPIAMHSQVHQPTFHISHSMDLRENRRYLPKIPGTTSIFLLFFFLGWSPLILDVFVTRKSILCRKLRIGVMPWHLYFFAKMLPIQTIQTETKRNVRTAENRKNNNKYSHFQSTDHKTTTCTLSVRLGSLQTYFGNYLVLFYVVPSLRCYAYKNIMFDSPSKTVCMYEMIVRMCAFVWISLWKRAYTTANAQPAKLYWNTFCDYMFTWNCTAQRNIKMDLFIDRKRKRRRRRGKK